jgi:preprotein translocase subunit SecF
MIDVLRYRYFTAVLSAAILTSFVGCILYHVKTRGSAFSYSIDFTGGAEFLLKISSPLVPADVRSLLEGNDWQGVSVRTFSSHELLIRVKNFSQDAQALGIKIKQQLNDVYSSVDIQILQSETVSAGIGSILRLQSLYAIMLALLIMVLYIALRFWSFAFAAGALVALFHDTIVVLAFFLFLDREVSLSLVAAVLTMLGYSINDTIVIFSQIRDNLKIMRHQSIEEIVTVSINQTLRRSILTSFATALAVFALFLFGGEALRDISLALLVGIIFGTYSSIYIASPVMMLFHKKNV